MKSFLPIILFILLFICIGTFNILSRLQLGAELRNIDYLIPVLPLIGILLFLSISFVVKLSNTTDKEQQE